MMLVTSGLTIALLCVLKFFIVLGKYEVNEYLAVPYVLIHALGAVCTYKEWVPDHFKQYPKDVMQREILFNFILANSVPLINFHVTLFGMFPIFVISYYLQLQEEKKILEHQFSFLPPEVRALSRDPSALLSH